MSRPAIPSDQPSDISELRAELASVQARLAKIEVLLGAVWGPSCLGGPAPVTPAPAVAEQPKPSRVIGVIGGCFSSGPR
jgi:hypothetical protein